MRQGEKEVLLFLINTVNHLIPIFDMDFKVRSLCSLLLDGPQTDRDATLDREVSRVFHKHSATPDPEGAALMFALSYY